MLAFGAGIVLELAAGGSLFTFYAVGLFTGLLGLLLLRSPRFQPLVSYPVILVPWAYGLWEGITVYGLQGPGLALLLIYTVLAVLLWRPPVALAFVLATLVGVVAIYLSQISGHVSGRVIDPGPALFGFIVVELVGAYVTLYAVRALRRARQAAQEEAARAWEEIQRRESAEAKLARAMRMEAVGRLAGGIAHDFNNLLTAVASNLESVRAGLRPDDEIRARLESALQAVSRGSRLTRQLLAYARKDTMHVRPVDVHELLESMHHLLRRTLGEKVVVALSIPDDLWRCRTDPGQLEAAILNLAINARDAMDDGGELFIGAANDLLGPAEVGPRMMAGRYVRITVEDQGSGMSPEVLERACDPFFTTKGEGRGTGLGLSMVQGFAVRSGGMLRLESEPGRGTRASVWVPFAQDEGSSRDSTEHVFGRGRGQLVLVVEDDPDVREASVALFSALGYRPIAAPDGAKALKMLDRLEPALLFSDVVLPGGLNGPELARRARKLRPGLPVLLTSGYTGDEIGNVGDLPLIQKPFRARELRERLEELLSETASTQEIELPRAPEGER